MQSQLPILIFAQSARFIAESATHAGYTVWVADCFCDCDTLAVASRSLKLAPLSTLSETDLLNAIDTLSQGQPCRLIIGTGIELFYNLVNKLPDHIAYVGNSVQTLSLLRQPEAFFNLLDNHSLPYPTVCYKADEIDASNWIYKSLASFGGLGIANTAASKKQKNGFYQHLINGQSASACFIANGKQAKILSVNLQTVTPQNFQLLQIQTPFEIPAYIQQQLEHVIVTITSATELKGIASLDFMMTDNGIFILEINPRYSASAELTPFPSELFQWHLKACQGILPDIPSHEDNKTSLLTYVYADSDGVIIREPNWSESCHDLPHAGSTIREGAPICTIIVEADNAFSCHEKLKKEQALVQQNFAGSA
jgi:predicted ATP-grasp superfamily ATP-dependent carboligase